MVSSISSNSNVSENGSKYWEKKLTDVNDVDEKFANARDIGYTRLNYARTSAVAKLTNNDTSDMYKVQVQSDGKLAISLRASDGENDKVLDLSKYDSYLEDLKKQFDPEGYAKEQEEKEAELAKQNLLEVTAPGMHMQVYMIKNGKEVLVGDSHAEKGSKERDALESMIKGEYRAKKGTYYVKLERTDETPKSQDIPYVLQLQQGSEYKHDYAMIEQSSEDTKNKKTSMIPSSTSSTGTLSSVNALQIQATRYQATAQMLQIGYLNMADIYSRNSKY